MGSATNQDFSIQNLTRATPSYKTRTWTALAGLLFFVTIYLLFTGWLIISSYHFLIGTLEGDENSVMSFLCALSAIFLSVFMVKGLFFLKRGGNKNYHEIKAHEEPELVEFIHQVADETGAPRPLKIFLTPLVNAAVFYDLSILNFFFPSKKNLLIGLGLVNVLNRSEFKAVLAHEFGHFSQRSMAIGRWVYTSEQITARIVGTRGILDGLLDFISHIDIRIAWIGWIMSMIVWSIRSLMETLYRLVSMTHMALSREMEYQADLVSVSITGSDALINGLHKTQAADESWSHSLYFLDSEISEKRTIKDLFTVHKETMNHLRRILADPTYGVSPERPSENPQTFRVFKKELAQPPKMWMTHPVNSDREENAKKTYLFMEIDEQSAWDLFSDPQKLKNKITADMLKEVRDVESVPMKTTLEHLHNFFNMKSYDRKYQGVYLGREVTRHLEKPEEMYSTPVKEDLFASISRLYPKELSEKMEELRNLQEEYVLLEAIKHKQMEASGGFIKHRGEKFKKSNLPEIIEQVSDEQKKIEQIINKHETECRTVFKKVADSKTNWDKYHHGHCRLLHYAEHSYANIEDLAGVVGNVAAVVTADGRVSSEELDRLLAVAGNLHRGIKKIYDHKDKVILSPAIASELKIKNWSEKLEDFNLPFPVKENIDEWMKVIESLIQVTLIALSELKTAALNQLLSIEEDILSQHKKETERVMAPNAPESPAEYDVLLTGNERELQTQLKGWDRIFVADGAGPLIMRLLLACSIIGSLVFLGSIIGNNDFHIYNGLNTPVQVNINDRVINIRNQKVHTLSLPLGVYDITTSKYNGVTIDSLSINIDKAFSNIVYNVASASPIVEHTLVYGNSRKGSHSVLGNPRSFSTKAQYIFTEPPARIRSSSSETTKTFLQGCGDLNPVHMLSMLKDPQATAKLIQSHAIWDPVEAKHTILWFFFAYASPGFSSIVKRRLEAYPGDILSERILYKKANEEEKNKMITAWKKQLQKSHNPDLVYLLSRTGKDLIKRNKDFFKAYKQHPDHPWFTYTAGITLIDSQQHTEGLKALTIAENQLPGIKVQTEVIKERIRRYNSRKWSELTDDLLDKSYFLYQLVSLENGFKDNPFPAYSYLHKGELEKALNSADTKNKERILRLAAMSDGAEEKWAYEAMKLPLPENPLELWISYGLKMKASKDGSSEKKKLLELSPSANELVFIFLDSASTTDIADLTILNDVGMETRAIAYFIARYLGAQNIELTRYPKYMLFTSERPYIR